MKRILSIGVLILAAVSGNLWAQAHSEETVFHAQLMADGGLPFSADLPYTGYDRENDTISFSDGTIFVDISGWIGGAFTINLKVKNRPYRQSIHVSDKRLKTTDDEYYVIHFVADVQAGGITMNTPVSYTILKGSYIQVAK